MEKIFRLTLLALLIQSCNNTSLAPKKGLNEKTVQVEEIKDTSAYIKKFIFDYYHQKANKINEGFIIDSSGEIQTDYINLKIVGAYDSLIESYPVYENHGFNKNSFLICGDLNGDNINDVVVNVNSDEGGSLSQWWDIFLFISNGKKLEMINVYRSDELVTCNYKGAPSIFIPTKIKENNLIGDMFCYTENDPSCCPSLKYLTRFIYKDSLILKEQIQVEAEKNN